LFSSQQADNTAESEAFSLFALGRFNPYVLVLGLKALISALQPPPEVLSDGEYSYSEARIAEIDAVRHQVVHEDPREIPSIEDDLRYLEATAIRFLGHTAVKYKSFSGRLMWGEPK